MAESRRPRPLLALLVLAATLPLLFPFYWMLTTAVRPEAAILGWPPKLLPTGLDPLLFFDVFHRTAVLRWMSNTMIVAGSAVVLVAPVAILAAYGVSRYSGGRVSLVSLLLVATQMMPPVLLIVPYFIIFREMGLLDGLAGLMLANFAWTLPVTAWLMKSAFDAVPVELEEAAMVDGCTRHGAVFRVAVPLAMPGLVASSVYAFVAAWDEYFFARTLIADSRHWVISVGLGSFTSDHSTSWQQIMAVATISTIPPVLMFIIAQRAFVGNLTAGGVKG